MVRMRRGLDGSVAYPKPAGSRRSNPVRSPRSAARRTQFRQELSLSTVLLVTRNLVLLPNLDPAPVAGFLDNHLYYHQHHGVSAIGHLA